MYIHMNEKKKCIHHLSVAACMREKNAYTLYWNCIYAYWQLHMCEGKKFILFIEKKMHTLYWKKKLIYSLMKKKSVYSLLKKKFIYSLLKTKLYTLLKMYIWILTAAHIRGVAAGAFGCRSCHGDNRIVTIVSYRCMHRIAGYRIITTRAYMCTYCHGDNRSITTVTYICIYCIAGNLIITTATYRYVCPPVTAITVALPP